MSVGGEGILVLVGGMFLLIGSILSTVFCWGLPGELGIDLHPLAVRGEVTAAEIDEHMRINRRHPLRIHYAYRYEGKRYEDDHATIDPGVMALGTVGATISLEIDSTAPAISRIAGTSRAFFGYWGALTLFFPALGLAIGGTGAVMWLRARAVRGKNSR